MYYTEELQCEVHLTDFKSSNNLHSQIELRKYLDDEISISKRIHKPDRIEIFVRQFLLDNEKVIVELNERYSQNKSLKFNLQTTNERLFDIDSVLRGKVLMHSSRRTIQNTNYVICSKFKGSVFGFNKSTKEFFVVWVPGDTYDWIDEMEFKSTGALVLYDIHDKNQYILIDLSNSIYQSIVQKEIEKPTQNTATESKNVKNKTIITFTMEAPQVVELGEQFSLAFTVNANGQNLKLPNLVDFDVLKGPNTSSSTSFQVINGLSVQEVTYSYLYVLRAKKVGRFNINPGSLFVNGVMYKSNMQTITVKGQ